MSWQKWMRSWDVPTMSSSALPSEPRLSGVRPGSEIRSGSRLLLLLLQNTLDRFASIEPTSQIPLRAMLDLGSRLGYASAMRRRSGINSCCLREDR